MRAEHRYNLRDLLRVMERLRDPEHGCPWDQAQDFRSIVPSTLEESYELAAAIEQKNYPHVAEELGDVLFQVVFYAQLGRGQGRGDIGKNSGLVLLSPHLLLGIAFTDITQRNTQLL